MSTMQEDVCCQSIGKVKDYIPDGVLCITDCPAFADNCLNRHVLEASKWEYMEHNGPFADDQHPNELVFFV